MSDKAEKFREGQHKLEEKMRQTPLSLHAQEDMSAKE
jgi:hypothetical protein